MKRIVKGTVIMAIVLGLFLPSIVLAQKEDSKPKQNIEFAARPASVMQVLMMPAGTPIDKCLVPRTEEERRECQSILDLENSLKNLMEEHY